MSIKTNYEVIALAKLLREADQTLFLGLNQELFTGQYAGLFKLISKEFSNTHKIPSISMLSAAVAEKAPRDLRPTLNGILSTMDSVDIVGISTDELLIGLKDKHLLITVDNSIQELNNFAMLRDPQGVRGVLNKIVEDINLDAVRPTSLFEAMECEDKSRIITSGIPELDEHILGVAGLTIISGTSGGGKSILLLQSAIGQYLQGYNILFVSLELSAQTLGNRLKSFLTGIPFSRINKDKGALLTDKERQHIIDTMISFKDRPNVFRIVTDPLDTSELLNLIKVEKSLYDIDVVHLDYLNLVSAPRGSENGWKNLSETAKSLHRLSMSLGVITMSASQVNLDKAPKAGRYPEVTTRGSAELQFSASLWIFIYSAEGEEDGGSADSAVFYVMKSRHSERSQILFEKKFSEMKFQYVMAL